MENVLAYCLIIYFVAINLISVAVCCADKRAAKKHRWRIKESSLFFLSAAGGSIGMYAAMKAIRHKTKHKRFMIGIPLIILLQVLIILFVIYLTND